MAFNWLRDKTLKDMGVPILKVPILKSATRPARGLDSPFIRCNSCELVDQRRLRLRMLTKEDGHCNGIMQ
jgi:hypothetical protein